MNNTVAICRSDGSYPAACPFDADEVFPEFAGKPVARGPNPVYRAVREALRLLGCDAKHFGAPDWNPFGGFIQPGNRVFIKPNLVSHEHRAGGDIFSIITHPSVVRAVADYAALALRGRGEIVIGDNPCIDADFDEILRLTQLRAFERLYRERFGVPCRVLDLRPRCTRDLKFYGFRSKTDKLAGDPEGSSVLNLGERSLFYGLNPLLFRGVFTNRRETIRHHHGCRHEYSISNTILNSDVYISVPKLKAHHKVGATLNVKGLVGVNANKNFLIHWRIGFPRFGGDEFPAARRPADYLRHLAQHLAEDLLPEAFHRRLQDGFYRDKRFRGAWDGNDTCWRMAADLYKLFVQDRPGGQFFSVVDGVMAGEGNGPFSPTAKPAEVILAGEDLLGVDCTAARLMDFDLRQIRYLDHLLQTAELPEVVSEDFDATDFFGGGARYLRFAPPSGWPRLVLEEAHVYEDHHSCCR